jgi:hypothetical protein
MGRQRHIVSATIPNGGSLSPEVAVGGARIAGIIMPAAWTAAALNFEALTDQTGATPTFKPVVDSGGTEVTITTGGDRYIALTDTSPLCAGLGRVKLRSGTSAAPVNQAADRLIKLVLIDD